MNYYLVVYSLDKSSVVAAKENKYQIFFLHRVQDVGSVADAKLEYSS